MRLPLTLFVCPTSAVCAETLPQIEGENLMGRKIVLPEAAAGYRAILVIGFSHASQGQTKAWADRLDRGFPIPRWSRCIRWQSSRPCRVWFAVWRPVASKAAHSRSNATAFCWSITRRPN